MPSPLSVMPGPDRASPCAKVQVVDPQYTFLLWCKWLAAFLSMVGFYTANL